MEFKVSTKKLRGSSGTIRSTAAGLRSARSDIESVIRNVNVGRGTDDIRNALRKTTGSLDTLSAAAGKFRTNLDAIATQYEVTEKSILNKKKKKGDLSMAATSLAVAAPGMGCSIKSIFGKGKKWWNKHVGDPVAVDSGNFIFEVNDLEIGVDGDFLFSRFYNSQETEAGALGRGWVHNFEMKLHFRPEGIVVALADGSEEAFKADGVSFTSLAGTSTLVQNDGKYYFRTIDEDSYIFDEDGLLRRYEDFNGQGYSLEYENGQLVKAVKDNGENFRFSYSDEDSSLLTAVTDHSGRTVSYRYRGRLLESVTSGDRVTVYGYSREGFLSDVTDPRGITIVHNEYDEEGRVVRQYFPDDSEMVYTYDEDNEVTVVREKDGSESYHFHDMLMRNTQNVYRDGSEEYEYDERNLVTEETDRNGNITKYQYDNRGNISKITMPNSAVINFTYEKHNKPVSISVNGVRRQKNVYDAKGNLLETTDALRRSTSYKYNDKGLPVWIRLPGGNTVEMDYDSRGNITRVLDEHGSSYFYEYDDLNRLVLTRDGKDNRTVLEYDRYGNLICVTDAAGNSRRYTFNEINKISEMTDFNGAVTRIEYNKLGLPCKMTDPLGRLYELEYDSMWNASAEKYPNGGIKHIEYDEYGRAVKETDPLGNGISYEYDGNGNLISRTDQEGAVTEFSYNSIDKLVHVKDPEGNETSYDYDLDGNLVFIRNANGGEVRIDYDEAGQMIRETDSLGQVREYSYTTDGDLAKVVDEAGRVATFEYASPGKPSRVVLPDGQIQTLTYDERGNVSSRANNRGLVLNYRYDELNRLTEVMGNSGEHSKYTYDAVGNLTSASDEKGNTIKYEYTLTGQVSSVIDELGYRTEYIYDALDQLIGIRQYGDDGEVHTNEYVRDIAGNITESVDPLGFREKFLYNGRGELTQKTDKDGYFTKFGYDKNGELTSVIYDDGREVMMSHDSLGRLSEIQDWTGITKVESDILGRVTKVIYPDERYAEYTYGKTGERTSLRHPDGRTEIYEYNKALQLVSLKEGETSVKYEYDESGKISCKTFSSGLVSRYKYDNKGQITELINSLGGHILDSAKITYDPYGNKTSVLRMRDGMPDYSGLFEYGYDPAGRLTSVSKDGAVQSTYEYDAFGNRKAKVSLGARTEYKYDAMDRLLETTGAVNEIFRYDNRGNLTEKISGGVSVNRYSYNSMNRLEKASCEKAISTYLYNGLGHRIEENVVYGLEPQHCIRYTPDMTRQFNNLLEINDNGEKCSYVWDGIVAAVKGKDNYEFACDEMGSPSRLIEADGKLAESYAFDEFGVTLYEGNGLQPVRYMGYMKDSVADMYFVQARDYLPEHGRFAGQDALKGNILNPATLNAYVYCGSMPLLFYDPNGLFWHVAVGAAIGGIVGGGMELGKQLIGQAASGKGIDLGKVNWGKVGTSALGGAVEGGILAACPAAGPWAKAAPYVAAGVSGLVEGIAESKFVEGKSWGESLLNGAVSAGIGVAFTGAGEWLKETKLGKKLADCTLNNNKFTKFFDKFGDNYKRQMTRAKNHHIHLRWKSVRNGIVGGLYSGATGYLKSMKWIKKWTGGAINCALGLS